jgi:hypothetical protein
MGNCYRWSSSGIHFGTPALSVIYINDLPNAISEISDPVLYADDTSLIITNSDSQMFEKDTKYCHTTIEQMV